MDAAKITPDELKAKLQTSLPLLYHCPILCRFSHGWSFWEAQECALSPPLLKKRTPLRKSGSLG